MFAADSTLTEWIQILTAVGVFLGVVVSGLGALIAQVAKIKATAAQKSSEENTDRLQTLAVKHAETDANVQKIELATNSMKDALVKATGDAAFAHGLAEGVKQEQDSPTKKG